MLELLTLFAGIWHGVGTAECTMEAELINTTIVTDGRCSRDDVGSLRFGGRLNDELEGMFFVPDNVRSAEAVTYSITGGFAYEADYFYENRTAHAITRVTWPNAGSFTIQTWIDNELQSTVRFTQLIP
jgi:hypothetical protein